MESGQEQIGKHRQKDVGPLDIFHKDSLDHTTRKCMLVVAYSITEGTGVSCWRRKLTFNLRFLQGAHETGCRFRLPLPPAEVGFC